MVATEDLAAVRGLLDRLPDRTYQMIMMRFGFYGEPQTLKSIAGSFGLSRERIREIIRRSLDDIKEHTDAHKDKYGFRDMVVDDPDSPWEFAVRNHDHTKDPWVCSECRIAEPLADRATQGNRCKLCCATYMRKLKGGKYVCRVVEHGWRAWFVLYPDAPNADAGRAACFAGYGRKKKRTRPLDHSGE